MACINGYAHTRILPLTALGPQLKLWGRNRLSIVLNIAYSTARAIPKTSRPDFRIRNHQDLFSSIKVTEVLIFIIWSKTTGKVSEKVGYLKQNFRTIFWQNFNLFIQKYLHRLVQTMCDSRARSGHIGWKYEFRLFVHVFVHTLLV